MSYDQQIMSALREVVAEADLLSVRDKILDGIRKYKNDPSQVIIEANLPKKNQNCGKSNFRGSMYRGPSKNRKKW